jgi:hypothetical protein
MAVTPKRSHGNESLTTDSTRCLLTIPKTNKQQHEMPKSRRKVSFDERIRIRATLSIGDMSTKEIDATWFSGKEIVHIRRSARNILAKIEHGAELSEEECYGLRGLEGRTGSRALIRDRSKLVALTVILSEQARQRQHGTYDASAFRRVYEEISLISHTFAHSLALQDYEKIY